MGHREGWVRRVAGREGNGGFRSRWGALTIGMRRGMNMGSRAVGDEAKGEKEAEANERERG